jgi:hypothetical protein
MFYFETGSHYVTQGGLNLWSSCLSLPSDGITDIHLHLISFFNEQKEITVNLDF